MMEITERHWYVRPENKQNSTTVMSAACHLNIYICIELKRWNIYIYDADELNFYDCWCNISGVSKQ